jgi:hypothetical protein
MMRLHRLSVYCQNLIIHHLREVPIWLSIARVEIDQYFLLIVLGLIAIDAEFLRKSRPVSLSLNFDLVGCCDI